jgi:hypothetical protein
MSERPAWADEPTAEHEPVSAPLLTPGQLARGGPRPPSEQDDWMTADERVYEYARWRAWVRHCGGQDANDLQE